MVIYGRIYLITNLINGKQYIGQTIKTIEKRFKYHCYSANNSKYYCMPIVRSIKKYSKENFKVKEISVAYTQEQLNFSEGFYISLFNTMTPNGYNVINIINGNNKYSEETKQKMKIAANRPENLKRVSEEGKKRRGKSLGGRSKYCGVSFKNNKYISNIKFNNKQIHIGCYYLELDAAKAYDISAIKYFGNNAVLNFPELREDYIDNKIKIDKILRKKSNI